MKKNLLLLFALISSFQFVSAQTLSSAPILTFTNNMGISTDNIASDGDGGSVNISDFDIQFYNISNEAGTFVGPLSWENASFYFATITNFKSCCCGKEFYQSSESSLSFSTFPK